MKPVNPAIAICHTFDRWLSPKEEEGKPSQLAASWLLSRLRHRPWAQPAKCQFCAAAPVWYGNRKKHPKISHQHSVNNCITQISPQRSCMTSRQKLKKSNKCSLFGSVSHFSNKVCFKISQRKINIMLNKEEFSSHEYCCYTLYLSPSKHCFSFFFSSLN